MPSGLEFPLRITAGRFSVVDGTQKYRQNIQQIVSTYLRSRWFEPAFGTTAYGAVFANLNQSTANILKNAVDLALRQHEPRINATTTITPSTSTPGTIIVDVVYRVKPTDEVDSFEFEIGSL